jgi:hypothetical protein
MVRWGEPPCLGGMVTTKHRLPRYQTTNILKYKDTKVKTYEVTKATILPVTTNASQPGGPHKGGRRIYIQDFEGGRKHGGWQDLKSLHGSCILVGGIISPTVL